MNRKICVSLGEMPFIECLQLASLYPLVEIRLDQLKVDPEKIEILSLQCRQWIATCRPCNLSERERTVLLAASIRAGAAYVDIEYEAGSDYRQTLTDLAKSCQCKVIISYHNFESTPDINSLSQIIQNSKNMGADCVKIAVTANSVNDCALVMSLYSLHDNLLAFAMGDAGKITRVAAPFLGAGFTYASINEARQTAPGQLTASQMEVIYRLIGN